MQLQAPTYGLAEQAATIIRSLYNGIPVPWATTIPPANSQGSGSGGGSGTHSAGSTVTSFTKMSNLLIAFLLLYLLS